jgi:2-methylcitrate dehydratase PrpD
MTTASQALAQFAAGVKYEGIPAEVIARAKASIIDTVAACAFGAQLPWSRIISAYGEGNSAPGKAAVIGTRRKLSAPFAALANGAAAHAFEMDSLVHPSVGVHPGASLTAPGLAMAQAHGTSGAELIAAFVAGSEVMYRIGDAARHSSEKLGFHAPGLTGVFGGAIVAGRLCRLDAERMALALGIGGSLCSGLLEFSKSGGGMVKRLHLGRAAEGGVLAAALARDGFTGPAEILEGKFGFLKAYARDVDEPRLTAGFGATWHTLKIMLKRYACHITAHIPVTAALALKAEHGIKGRDVASIAIAGGEKMVSHHNIPEPHDLAMAQYSTPFCVALALYRDPLDPRSFSEESLADPAIRALAKGAKVSLRQTAPGDHALVSRVTVKLKDGRELACEEREFAGMPSRPLTEQELAEKFLRLTKGVLASPEAVLEKLMTLETVENCATLDLS